eukprot:scaffold28456_cov37-Prasinocladus_malaysianus.AAC.1
MQRFIHAGLALIPAQNNFICGELESTVTRVAGDPMFPPGEVLSVAWHSLQQALASLLPDDEGLISTSKGLSSLAEDEQDDCVRLSFEDGSVVRCKA